MKEAKLSAFEFHEQEERELSKKEIYLKGRSRFFSWFRFVSFILIFPCILASAREVMGAEILAIVCLLLFLWGVKRSIAIQTILKRCRIGLEIHRRELKCLAGHYGQNLEGLEFLEAKHPYALDLDIFGPESLFQQVCRCATPEGTRKLAAWMKIPYAPVQEVKQRQAVVQELAQKPHLSIKWRIAAKLNQKNQQEYPESLTEYLLKSPFFGNNRFLPALLTVLPVLTCLTLLTGLLDLTPMLFFWACAVVQLMITARYLKQINAYQSKLSPVIKRISVVNALMQVYEKETFEQSLLNQMQERAVDGMAEIQHFHKLLNALDLRNNMIMGLVLNALFLFDLQCILRLEKWKQGSTSKFGEILTDIYVLDVFQSLAMWAFHHADYCFPEWDDSGQHIHASHLKHPLMKPENAVGNTLDLEMGKQMILLTGANMTGKSTWLRTVGLSVVCSYLGLPVSAKSYQLSSMRVFTSMRINDSLDSGVSYFKAELNRLKALVEAISPDDFNWLVIIDEPLRGTNSGDKQAGTVGILNKCIRNNVCGILATHDTSLCRLENETLGRIKNAHFDSAIENQQLTFDYTLKSGCSLSNNATILLQIAGIVD